MVEPCLCKEPEVGALSAVLIDGDSGRVLWSKDSDKPMAMASTTKIMTAIVAIEQGDIKAETTVSRRASLEPKVKLNLKAGERATVEQLLYAMLLISSNDAAVAVAEAVGGSVEQFCFMMDEKARELGCVDTHFETPNGLDKGEHHSTAEDMAKIAAYAIKNKTFMTISNTRSYSFTTDRATYNIVNKNRLLSEYSGAIGVKTGFTGKAGHCFVGAAERDDRTLISVVLASGWGSVGKSRKWTDTKQILDYGFNNFKSCSIIAANDYVGKIPVDKSVSESIEAVFKSGYKTLVSESDSYDVKVNIPDRLTAPVEAGQQISKADVFINGERVYTVDVVAGSAAARITLCDALKQIMSHWFDWRTI
jgi:D-alanyl-D-alanine carboxypeptidase (penicillin-binding protein 5/6)